MIGCSEAREGLWPPERPRLAGDEVLKARSHVEGCASCTEYFAQDTQLLGFYDQLRQTGAPRAVRERVFDALAAERAGTALPLERPAGRPRSPWDRLRRGTVGLAASLAAVLLAWTWIGQVPIGPVAEGSIFIEDYLRRAVGEDQIHSSDPGEVSRFLARELGIAHTPMVSDGLRLAGAEVCLLEGRRGAMIRYEKDGSSVSHYIVPVEGIDERGPAISMREGWAPSIGSSPAVVTWAVSSLEQALVGDLAPEVLLALAEEAVKR